MHYERSRTRGRFDSADKEVNRGEAWVDASGYITISFYGKQLRVHQLVYALTYGPIPKGYHIHHKDGDKRNNHWDNLQCVTPKEHKRLHAA